MIKSIEKQMFLAVASALIAAGHDLTVDYERGYESSGVTDKDGVEGLWEAAYAVDECWLMIDRDGDTYAAFVYFIWGNGNEGRDCISDYTATDELEALIAPLYDAAND